MRGELYRRRRRVLSGSHNGDVGPDAIDTAANPEEQLLKSEQIARLASAVQQLKDEQRKIVELRILQGLSYKAIAAKLGRNESTVGVQLRRGFQKLGELLREKGKSDG